jgi:hypothetical protein
MSTKMSKNGAYDMLVAQKDTITKIMGIITPKSINTLENKLGGAFTILKSTHFNKGQRYGFLATVIPQAKYCIVINNPTWVYAAPGNPGVYAAAALGANVSTAQCEQIVARHKEEQTLYANYLSAQEAGKELLLYGMGNNALAPLKKQYINFGDATIHSMILYLQEKMAIKMTTSQKFEYKSKGYAKQWDLTTSITAYFTGLDKFRTSLTNCGISTSINKMTMAALEHGCGSRRCLPRTKWSLGKTSPPHNKHGRYYETTSQRNGWNAASIHRRRQNIRVSRTRPWQHKR